jgi:hypothetical protein
MLTLQPVAGIVEPQEGPKLSLREFQFQVLDRSGRSAIVREYER